VLGQWIGHDLQMLCFLFIYYNGPKELCLVLLNFDIDEAQGVMLLLLNFDVDDGLKVLFSLLHCFDVDDGFDCQ
jgi:hypothetical protein